MIDIHCHILPGVDDGAKSWDMAAEMCRLAAADGITDLVATPHANEEYAYDRPRLREMLQRLQSLAGGSPRMRLGCDFHLSYENIQAALARFQWNRRKAAEFLNVSYKTLLNKIRESGITDSAG